MRLSVSICFCNSICLLNYIDPPPLRQGVQKALNRGVNYHQLAGAISHAGLARFVFQTEYEQEL